MKNLKSFEKLNEATHIASEDIHSKLKLGDEVKTKEGEVVTGLGKEFMALNNGAIGIADKDAFSITKNNISGNEMKIYLTKEEMQTVIEFANSHNIK